MIKEKAYAKVNLGLEVVKRTKKNYHKLRMVMTQIELYDEICFEENDEIVVEMDKPVCKMEDNLCYKVATYLKKKYGVHKGVRIYIKKNIPEGGGLGGGSSDAATVLKGLNKFWCLGLSQRKLKKIGFMFGCDIPFFLEGNISYVSGYGEKIKPIRVKEKNDNIILVIPAFKNSTKTIFENHVIVKRSVKNTKKLIKKIKYSDYKEAIFNELETSANKCSGNKIEKIKQLIKRSGYKNVIMTGSGSTIVVYLDEFQNVDDAISVLNKTIDNCLLVKTKLKMYT